MIELDVLSARDVAADDDAQAAAGQAPTWRSRASRAGAPTPSGEFQAPVTEADAGTSRRSFMKVMGASVALAGLSGCRRPVETILPYARKPEDVIPGIPDYYATAMTLGGVGFPLLVQSHEGRPTKVEGNPEHPMSRGASGAFAQASVLQLYDPDRSRYVWTQGETAPAQGDWGAFVAEAGRIATRAGDLNVAVLAEPSASPSADALRDRFLGRYPGARWITLGAGLDDAQTLGLQDALGQPARPLHRLADADVVVSFDADFLGEENPNGVFDTRQYAASRRVDERGSMSRLYVVESTMTPTGGMADHRRALRAGMIPFVAAAVAERLGVGTGATGALATDEALEAFIDAVVADVRAAGSRAAFLAGPTQPREVHALAAALNGRFGADVVEYLATGAAPVEPVGPQLVDLVADMAAGRVDVLLMLGTNPVYTLPASLGFEAALARVPVSIHHGLYRDETGQRATWHVPAAHYLESWGDARAYDGTVSIVQPLIAPLYDAAHSQLEVVNTLTTGRNNTGYDLLRLLAREYLPGDFETGWRVAIHDGFVADSGFATVSAAGAAADLSGVPAPTEAYELVTRLSPTLYDGAFSNVSWMQELPHPVTKVTWDPVALVAPATAEALGLEDGDRFAEGEDDQFEGTTLEKGKHLAPVVRLTAADGSQVLLPVWVQPGQPEGSITAYLGYGREFATDRPVEDLGAIGKINRWLRPGKHDTNVYRMGPLSSLVGAGLEGGPTAARVERCRSLSGAVVPVGTPERVAGDYLLASTQDHGTMQGRAIVRMADLETYRADPAFAKIEDHFVEDTPWENFEPLWGDENSAAEDPRIGDWIYSDNQWGMTIDLNACTGCNACVVACQSENNVPVVGKDQVAVGREMHWLRMDRYYVGADENDPGMVSMPMMCVHCENAPCEQVCPVNATAHSPDGLNEMTYNRCIGTRYCANNCPYKVRRYNFYNWTKELPLEVQMQSNPYVTVRYRGVMEKCTFCVQRIRQTQQTAHIADEPIADGTLQTACQQACAADAIVFGDLTDRTSQIARSKESPRNYAVLEELAIKPRLTYLARLRNPSPALAGIDTRFDTLDDHGAHDAAEAHAEPAA